MTRYTARVTRDGRWWMVSVPELDILTQARRISEIEKMAQELIAVTLDMPLSEVEVDLEVGRIGEVQCVSRRAQQIRAEQEHAKELERQSRTEAEQLARELAKADVPMRDIGTLLGVSFQRVHQLVH